MNAIFTFINAEKGATKQLVIPADEINGRSFGEQLHLLIALKNEKVVAMVNAELVESCYLM